ncbi:YoaK family protein [Aerococcus urinae]|uniref:YoaK family protein n=1 Tax=Aerococcus urinae TaxID=1376 RepID=UPI0018E18438|nr:YoaK family protein [Aerococcus urinae]
MKKTQKLAEKLFFSCLLTMSSGGQTAYSYLNHKGVFAGFQSGNLIRMAVNLGQGHFADLPPYFVSIIFFMIGTVLTRILHFHYDDPSHEIRRNALVLIISFLAMAVVAWISQTGHHLLATAFLTISTAAQFEEFRSLEGTNYTPTMMSGNFKRLTENLFDYFLYPNATVKASAKSNIFLFYRYYSLLLYRRLSHQSRPKLAGHLDHIHSYDTHRPRHLHPLPPGLHQP